MTPEKYSDYIERNQPLVEFFCRSGQWSGVEIPDIRSWINNFQDEEGKYYAVRLLKHFIFYSENDMIALLHRALFQSFFERECLNKILQSNFTCLPSIAQAALDPEIRSTVFIPLLSANKPHESGEAITRLLVRQLQIPSSNVLFHWDFTDSILKNTKRIIIVDDNIGSGDQLENYWTSPERLPYGTFNELRNQFDLDIIYITLLAVQETCKNLNECIANLRIIACEELTSKHRVFSDDSIFWNSIAERDKALNYISQVVKERGLSLMGYADMDYAVSLHKTIPDWTLPIFWKETINWKPLIRRNNLDG